MSSYTMSPYAINPIQICIFSPRLYPLFFIALCSFMFQMNHSASAEVVDHIVAVVGGEAITLSELNELMRPVEAKMKSVLNPADYEQQIEKERMNGLEELIKRHLIIQAADESGIEVTEAEVDSQLKLIIQNQGLTPEQFLYGLQKEGSSLEDFKKQLKEFILQNKFIQIQVREKLNVSEKELKDAFQEYISTLKQKSRVKGAHIFLKVSPGSTRAQEAAIKQRALELRARAKAGENFQELAQKFSEGQSAQRGGDLGIISRGGGLPKQVEDGFFKLKLHELSEPVRSDFGYHILYVSEVFPVATPAFNDVKNRLHQMLYQKKQQSAMKEWVEETKSSVFIDRRL